MNVGTFYSSKINSPGKWITLWVSEWKLLQFSSVHSLSPVRLFVTPWIAARQASPSISNSQSSLKRMSIESVMPSSHLILCCPLLLLPPIPPSIRVFSNESTLCMRWPKYWSFRANKPSCHNYWVCALELGSYNYWIPHVLQPMLCNKRIHCNEKSKHCT